MIPYRNIWLANIFSHSIDCFFHFVDFFPFQQKLLDGGNAFAYFASVAIAFDVRPKITNTTPNTAKTVVNELFSCFFKNLYGFRPMFEFLIHFELIFVGSVRWFGIVPDRKQNILKFFLSTEGKGIWGDEECKPVGLQPSWVLR